MAVINVPRALREQLGEQATDDLVDLLNQVVEDSRREAFAVVEEKFERRLSEELAVTNQHIVETKSALEQQIVETRTALEQQIVETKAALEKQIAELEIRLAQTKAELQAQIANVRADMIRWMFIFWVGQLAAMTGILYAFLSAFLK